MVKDKEQVDFINSLFSDNGKTWQERWNDIVDWRNENRGLTECQPTFYPDYDGTDPTVEQFAEELCRKALKEAKGA